MKCSKIRKRLPLLALIGFAAFLASAKGTTAGNKEEPVKLKATASTIDKEGRQSVTVTMEIAKDWHAYANPVNNEFFAGTETQLKIVGPQKIEIVKVDYPAGKQATDVLEGKKIAYMIYEGRVEITAVVKRTAGDSGPLTVSVRYNVCNDVTHQCLAPAQVKLEVKTPMSKETP
jgi:hypothetical protein